MPFKAQSTLWLIILTLFSASLSMGARIAFSESIVQEVSDFHGNQNSVLPLAIEHFPPFEFEQDDGTIVGFDTEIVQQVLEEIGYKVEISVLPWSRALAFAKSGDVAGIYSLTWSEERAGFLHFSEPISTVKDVFFKLKSKPIQWQTLDHLTNYRLGISRGYNYAPEFMKAVEAKFFTDIDILAGKQLELTHLHRLKAERVDLVLCEISVCQYLIKTHAPKFNMIDYIDRPLGSIRSYHIGFSKQWPNSDQIVRDFNKALVRFIEEGKRDSILKRYGVENSLVVPSSEP